MAKIKVIDLIVILPIVSLVLWYSLSASSSSSHGHDVHKADTNSAERDDESIKVSVFGPNNDQQILSLDPYITPSIVNDVHEKEDNVNNVNKDGPIKLDNNNQDKKRLTSVKEFQKLFKLKRNLQVQAVQGLIQIQKYEKKFEMVTKIFSKIFQLQQESKSIIENSPFIPGGVSETEDPPLPTDVKTLDSLSSLIENCALIGDIILHLPDITHRLLDKNQPWLLLTKHCIVFTKSTRLLDPVTEKMINFAAQEINLVPRDGNYVNPYVEIPIKDGGDGVKDKKSVIKEQKMGKDKKKKEKKDVKKGPRLSKKVEL